MSLKHTETVYNLVIEHVIKEITDDPQMNSISTEAIEYLSKTWRTKLNDTGVYTPHLPQYPPQHAMSPFPIQPMPMNYPSINATSTSDPNFARMMQQMPYYSFPPHMPDRDTYFQPQMYTQNIARFNNSQHMGNIQYNAKATLSSGNQPNMQQSLVQQPIMDHLQANAQYAATMKDKIPVNNNVEAAKNSIYIKSEPTREEEGQQTAKTPVKVATNGTNQGLIDVSTPKRNPNNEATANIPKEKDKAPKNPMYEEEKKDNVFQSDEERDEEAEEGKEEEDDDDARLFDYDIDNKPDIQPKEEHIPPPLQQGNAAQQPVVNLRLTDLDPYDPQERPLDSDDDPDYDEQPETTDILIAFHEKVHRHGSKWKVILKQGIMNAKGKEYLLSQITGDFDFM